MSDALDFTPLSDDQLVALIRAALREAAGRTLACKVAAEGVLFDEAEKARIAQDAAVRETEKLAREEAERIAREAAEKVRRQKEAAERAAGENKVAETWKYKEEMGAKIAAILQAKRELGLKIWLKGADKRIYIGGGYDDNVVEYYYTGTSKQKPRSGVVHKFNTHRTGVTYGEIKAELLPLLEEICKKWNTITMPIPEFVKETEEDTTNEQRNQQSITKPAVSSGEITCQR